MINAKSVFKACGAVVGLTLTLGSFTVIRADDV